MQGVGEAGTLPRVGEAGNMQGVGREGLSGVAKGGTIKGRAGRDCPRDGMGWSTYMASTVMLQPVHAGLSGCDLR